MLILVDSGSTHSFISNKTALGLHLKQTPVPSFTVRVANGETLTCDRQLSQCSWTTQGHTFSTDLRVLNLSCYDIVLGMDWLEDNSPIMHHWDKKKMSFLYQGHEITLQGVVPNLTSCTEISAVQLLKIVEADTLQHLIYLCPNTEVTPEVHPAPIEQLITEYSVLFEEPKSLPPHRNWDHHIPLMPGTQPVCIRPYRYTPAQKTEIETQVKEMLQCGLITPSVSPFSSPVLLAKKKDGTWHFCVDYRHLNAITVKNKYPLPIIDELLDELHGASWFTILDLRAGYHQFRLCEADEMKTAFQTHHGHFEFRVKPYGLCNAPATFQSAMNEILGPLLRKSVLVFIDDILIYSPDLATHVKHVEEVFQLLKLHGLKVKRSKCTFAQRTVSYLGHIISAEGVSPGDKISEITTWPTPVNAKELRSFLGLAGYYRKFVSNFGLISKPLTDLLKKHTTFQWTPLHEASFQLLKEKLTQAPVLALPDFSKQFIVETDASDKGIGAVLMQDSHPVAYLSKALCPRNQSLGAYERNAWPSC